MVRPALCLIAAASLSGCKPTTPGPLTQRQAIAISAAVSRCASAGDKPGPLLSAGDLPGASQAAQDAQSECSGAEREIFTASAGNPKGETCRHAVMAIGDAQASIVSALDAPTPSNQAATLKALNLATGVVAECRAALSTS
jgi:hypothetical protein